MSALAPAFTQRGLWRDLLKEHDRGLDPARPALCIDVGPAPHHAGAGIVEHEPVGGSGRLHNSMVVSPIEAHHGAQVVHMLPLRQAQVYLSEIKDLDRPYRSLQLQF